MEKTARMKWRALAIATVIVGICVPAFAIVPTADMIQPFGYCDFGALLQAYVDDEGMVKYGALEADRAKLDAFAGAIGSLDPAVFDTWADNEKIVFWINAYNGLTLKAIIDHYPIKPSFIASLRFPKNSIRQIPGVWEKLKFRVMGREMTLDEIEHANLRRNFNEPRIHMALVCAAMGCPPLRNEPYANDRLDSQLDDQTRRFLSDPLKFRIDREGGRVYLSSIFKWFGGDFVKTHGVDDAFAKHSRADRAVLNFISRYLDEADSGYLSTREYAIEYLDYDWSLNEQETE